MKPFQIILLAVFGLLALFGLILFASFQGFGGGEGSTGSVEIWGTLPQVPMDAALGSLKADDSSFSGVSYRQVSEAAFDGELAEALASGVGPDLVLISQEQLASQQSKLTTIPESSISERQFVDAYLPITELFLAAEGTYGVPFAVDPLVLYYNRALLSSSGILSPPSTWEAVTSYAETLTQRSGSSIVRAIAPLGVYQNTEAARGIVSLLLLQTGNPISTVTGNGIRPSLATGAVTELGATPAQSALSFYTQFADPAKTVYTWSSSFPSARNAFIAGNLMFYIGYASELPSLRASNPNLDFDMGALPQPGTTQARVGYAKAYAFAVPRASDNAAGAFSAAYALSEPVRAAASARLLSMAPATRSQLMPLQSDKFEPIYFYEALTSRGWLSPSPAATDRIFSTMIENIVSGRVPIGQALSQADQALEAAY